MNIDNEKKNIHTLIKPIEVKRTDVLILDALTRYIAQANIQVGEKIPAERELAQALSVSRNTVREALKRWETLGIVFKVKGSGTFLKSQINTSDSFLSLRFKNDAINMEHTLEMRRIIEVEANVLAASRATAAQLAIIEHNLIEMERVHLALGSAGPQDWVFHTSIYQAAGNPLLISMIEATDESFHAFFESPPEQALFRESFPLHRELYLAIAAHDGENTRIISHQILDIIERDMKEIINEK